MHPHALSVCLSLRQTSLVQKADRLEGVSAVVCLCFVVLCCVVFVVFVLFLSYKVQRLVRSMFVCVMDRGKKCNRTEMNQADCMRALELGKGWRREVRARLLLTKGEGGWEDELPSTTQLCAPVSPFQFTHRCPLWTRRCRQNAEWPVLWAL